MNEAISRLNDDNNIITKIKNMLNNIKIPEVSGFINKDKIKVEARTQTEVYIKRILVENNPAEIINLLGNLQQQLLKLDRDPIVTRLLSDIELYTAVIDSFQKRNAQQLSRNTEFDREQKLVADLQARLKSSEEAVSHQKIELEQLRALINFNQTVIGESLRLKELLKVFDEFFISLHVRDKFSFEKMTYKEVTEFVGALKNILAKNNITLNTDQMLYDIIIRPMNNIRPSKPEFPQLELLHDDAEPKPQPKRKGKHGESALLTFPPNKKNRRNDDDAPSSNGKPLLYIK